ncbi:Uma2 family endonuclease [Larkinella terrae]|uniref:Uma2 family endonuclease n=1 Tax=Larkinella terrae TaxID=2025311 RepID=A0A7K0ES78_9BACT|nr:Uma2 family endonuclease [Larkinella terrae]MRS64288.1 Uma2 family endonuclease [Larkinella terrae]
MKLTLPIEITHLPSGTDLSERLRSMTDDEFYHFCQENPDVKFERNSNGNIEIMALTGGETGRRNTKLTSRLDIWSDETQLGLVFDSSTGFKLPNGADRSPDVAWVSQKQWNQLTLEQKRKFPPLCPEFLVELMSETDVLRMAEDKMREYIDNGCRLAWLIDPKTETVRIYRTDGSVQVVQGFNNVLSGEDTLPGFTFKLSLLR